MLNITEPLIKLIEQRGSIFAKDTPECAIFLSEHSNCIGCPTQLGCSKLMRILQATALPISYQPKDFEDFQKLHNRVQELKDLILSAETIEELDKIPDV